MSPLSSSTALVTGASRGIGAAIAKALAARGARVVVHYREREESANAVVAAIRDAGGKASAMRADLADARAIEVLFRRIDDDFGPIDVLVNNAGLGGVRPLAEIDDELLRTFFSVNVHAVVHACREAARRMAGRGGRIVNVSSINGRVGTPGACVYAATKAAVESITKSLAFELGPDGITVNAVAPGFTESDMLASVTPRSSWPQLAELTALGRVGAPEDVAAVVAFLVSKEARWVTGQVIGADGGLRLG